MTYTRTQFEPFEAMILPKPTEQQQMPQTKQSPAKEASLNARWVEEVCLDNIRLIQAARLSRLVLLVSAVLNALSILRL